METRSRGGDGAPEMRASYAKILIGTAKRSPPEDRDAVLNAIGESKRKWIRELGTLGWIPAEQFLELTETVLDTLGAERTRRFWQLSMFLTLNRRLLTPLRVTAVALHGENPGSVLRTCPQAWQLVSRGCGPCDLEWPGEDSITLKFSGLPAAMTGRSMRYLWEGGGLSCLQLMDFQGESSSVVVDPHTVHMTTHWTR